MANAEEELVTILEDKQQADEDMAKLQLLHSNGDVVLTVGQREFPAHRILLAKASEYFQRMFNDGLKETNKKHVEIQGVDADILQALVGHCYCHPISVPASKLLDLLSAADMLQFPAVKKISLSLIRDRLTVDNVIDIYESAKLFSENELKTAAEAYMRNHFRPVSKQERFLDLEFVDLEVILSCEELDIFTEMDVFHSIETWCRHKKETREKHFTKLLKLVRLHDLPANVVVYDVASSPLVKSNLECMAVVMEYGVQQLPGVKQRSLHAGENIFVIGGNAGPNVNKETATNLVQNYSGSTKSWSSCPPTNEPRADAFAAGCMDKIYVYGGLNQEREYVWSMEMFCRRQEVWCAVKAPDVDRPWCGFCECDGCLYAIGGTENKLGCRSKQMKSAERYDPVRDEWHAIASLPSALRCVSAVNHKDSVYIFGMNDYPSYLYTFMYDPRINKFEFFHLERKSYDFYPRAAVSFQKEDIYVMSNGCQYVDILEPRQNKWRQCQINLNKRYSFTAVGYQDSVVVLGGDDAHGNPCTDVSAFDNKCKFTTFPHLPSAVSGCCAVVV